MERLIIFLICKRLGVKKFQHFKFNNQKDDTIYYFTNHDLRKYDVLGEGENSYSWGTKARVSFNWLLDENCKATVVSTNRD